jgi:hypothetical protein
MAPTFSDYSIFRVTDVTWIDPTSCSHAYRIRFPYHSDKTKNNNKSKFIETKKQRIERLAREKMFASWKVHNDKTMTIKEVIQICKPQHKLNHSGKR